MEKKQEKPTVEQAIHLAIELEHKIRDVYRDALVKATDETGKRVFKLLADEEQGHVDFLEFRLKEWKRDGKITLKKLATSVPSRKEISGLTKGLKASLASKDRGEEVEMLKKAEEVERQTSEFYRSMVEEMEDDVRKMFEHFLEIEEGHLAIVRAEIDALSGTGYFFEFGEFNMEAGG